MLQPGQRLSQSRFMLREELFQTPESSAYWTATDRDEDKDVILYFPPELVVKDTSALESFFERLLQWGESVDAEWHSIIHMEPNAKPYPFVVLSTHAGNPLENRLHQEGAKANWVDIEPLIEKVMHHLVQEHKLTRLHGRLSPEHIRFTADDEVVFLGAQLDRLALEVIREITDKPIPESWDIHATSECLETGVCRQADEVFSMASILLESIRHFGIHIELPKHVDLQGKVRFGNLLVPKNVKKALMDALDEDATNRPNTALRLSALLGFGLGEALEDDPVESLEHMAPDASERARMLIRGLFSLQSLLVLLSFAVIILGGWFIADRHQKQIAQEQLEARQTFNQTLILDVREAAPNDLDKSVVKGSSTLIVRTAPEEALLSLSGPGIKDVLEEFSPAQWTQMQEGAYQLSVLSVGHSPTNLYPFLESGKTNVIEIQLSEPLTEVKLSTQPSGGTYRFQNSSGEWITGLTPVSIPLLSGDYLIQFSMNGETLTKAVLVNGYHPKGMDIVAVFDGCRLQVQSYPDRAEVFINSERKGLTPLTIDGLIKGSIELELRKPGYSTRSEVIEISSDKLNSIRWSLVESGN